MHATSPSPISTLTSLSTGAGPYWNDKAPVRYTAPFAVASFAAAFVTGTSVGPVDAVERFSQAPDRVGDLRARLEKPILGEHDDGATLHGFEIRIAPPKRESVALP